MKAHTTLSLDPDQVREAADLLGTRGTGETVRAALAEVIRSRRRLRILDISTDLTLDDLRAMRAPRSSGRP